MNATEARTRPSPIQLNQLKENPMNNTGQATNLAPFNGPRPRTATPRNTTSENATPPHGGPQGWVIHTKRTSSPVPILEARMPTAGTAQSASPVTLLALMVGNVAIVSIYIGLPIALILRQYNIPLGSALAFALALLIIGVVFVVHIIKRTTTAISGEPKPTTELAATIARLARKIIIPDGRMQPDSPSAVS
jgi:hypothetical protein